MIHQIWPIRGYTRYSLLHIRPSIVRHDLDRNVHYTSEGVHACRKCSQELIRIHGLMEELIYGSSCYMRRVIHGGTDTWRDLIYTHGSCHMEEAYKWRQFMKGETDARKDRDKSR